MPGAITFSFEDDVITAVDESIEYAFGDDGIRKQAIPVGGLPVRHDEPRALLIALAHSFEEIVGPGRREFPEAEIIDNQQIARQITAQTALERAVGMAPG